MFEITPVSLSDVLCLAAKLLMLLRKVSKSWRPLYPVVLMHGRPENKMIWNLDNRTYIMVTMEIIMD